MSNFIVSEKINRVLQRELLGTTSRRIHTEISANGTLLMNCAGIMFKVIPGEKGLALEKL